MSQLPGGLLGGWTAKEQSSSCLTFQGSSLVCHANIGGVFVDEESNVLLLSGLFIRLAMHSLLNGQDKDLQDVDRSIARRFLDRRLTSENDSRVHGQPSLANHS